MSITRSKNVKVPPRPADPENVPMADVAAVQAVWRALGIVEAKAEAFREALDPFADDREQLESRRQGMRTEYFNNQLHATMQKHSADIAEARRELKAAHEALLEAVVEHTDTARRETRALMAAPEKIATAERYLGLARPSELVYLAQRAVKDSNLVDGAILRRLVAADTMPPDIREAVTETLSHMGAGLVTFGAQVAATAQQHRAQAIALESYASHWPGDPDPRLLMDTANGVFTEHDAHPPFDRAIERMRSSLDPKALVATANAA